MEKNKYDQVLNPLQTLCISFVLQRLYMFALEKEARCETMFTLEKKIGKRL